MNLRLKMCPVCAGRPSATFERNGYIAGTCGDCTHMFIANHAAHNHVAEVYSDGYFIGGGDGYPDYLAEEGLLVAHGRRYGRLLKRYMPPGRVLDVGAAAGFILKGLTEEGWSGQGLEPNPWMAQHAAKKYGLEVHTGALEDMTVTNQYDVITMIQVAAHFHDVRRAFEVASMAIKPGGWWLVETADRDSLPARIMGENWHFISPPSVQNWFSQKTLAELSRQFSMHPVATGRPQKWLNGAHAKSLLRHKLQGRLRTVALPALSLIPDGLPIPYPSLDLFWMLLRKTA